jgi:predicted metal-binding membrane protein
MWALMMVAMMLPSAAPMVLLHARLDRGSEAQRARDSALFMLCYIGAWAAFSALAAVAQAALVEAGALSAATLALGNGWLVAALLLLAAGWQLTAAKQACLDNCRSPIQFVMRHWKPGPAGAVRLGLRHGLYCLGCCWSLMLLLFVGGVMNLAWVALLAAVVFAEKLGPPRWRLDRWLAAALAAGAVAALVA